VNDGGTTTVNFSLSASSLTGCLTDTTTADFQRGTLTNVDAITTPDAVTLLNASGINQQNTSLGTSGFGVTTTQWLGQTFVPSVTGTVPKLDFNMFCFQCSGA